MLAPIVAHTGWKQYQDHLADKELFVHQQHYFDYSAAGDLIAYTEDPVLGQRSIEHDAAYVKLGNAACYLPKVLNELPNLPFGNGPPTLFIHARRSPDGTRMLVLVSLMALEDLEDLQADTFAPVTDDEPGLYHCAGSLLVVRRSPYERMTFMAGQPDSNDESTSIQYRLNDQSGTIDGCLADDGSVNLKVRDGPAQSLPPSSPAAGPRSGNASNPTTQKSVRTDDRKK